MSEFGGLWKDQTTQHTLKVSVFVIDTCSPRLLDIPSGVPSKRGTEYVIYTHPFHSPPTLHFPSYAILGNQSFIGRENKINNGNGFSRFRRCCLRVSVFWTGPLLSTLARLGQTSNQSIPAYPNLDSAVKAPSSLERPVMWDICI